MKRNRRDGGVNDRDEKEDVKVGVSTSPDAGDDKGGVTNGKGRAHDL
jgi:hypothetical protein